MFSRRINSVRIGIAVKPNGARQRQGRETPTPYRAVFNMTIVPFETSIPGGAVLVTTVAKSSACRLLAARVRLLTTLRLHPICGFVKLRPF